MKQIVRSRVAKLLQVVTTVATLLFVAGTVVAATPPVPQQELLDLGFKKLVATTKVQEDWVRSLAPGKIRSMQRTGKKFYIYPDAANKQVYVGGPKEFEAYQERHTGEQQSAQDAAAKASAYRGKQAASMRDASARDLSNPFLGVTWSDLGW